MSNYFSKIKSIISEKMGSENITADSYFEDDLNIGEMELIEIISELEEFYHVDLMENKEDIETVQDLIDLITEQNE